MKHLNLKEQFYEKFRTVLTSLHEKIYSKIHKTSDHSEFLFKIYAVTNRQNLIWYIPVSYFHLMTYFESVKLGKAKQVNLVLG